ncbi:MAG: transcription-repair coupling factor [Actinomycetales bacterium]|nr:transcription-repair coupling factor [Actinomycetales bacterium]
MPPAFVETFLALLAEGEGRLLVLVAGEAQAHRVHEALASLLGAPSVVELPGSEALPFERLAVSAEIASCRADVARRLMRADRTADPLRVVIASIRAASQPIIADVLDVTALTIRTGTTLDRDLTVRALVDLGYQRSALVTRRGEFAVRGGILDIFPPGEEHPCRVDLFGDEVEQIRPFRAADQRSIEQLPERAFLDCGPCGELLLTPAVRQRAADLAAAGDRHAADLAVIAEGTLPDGGAMLAPLLCERLTSLTALLTEGDTVVVWEPVRVAARAAELAEIDAAFAQSVADPRLAAAGFRELADLTADALRARADWLTVDAFGEEGPALAAVPVPSFAGDLDAVWREVRSRLDAEWTVVLTSNADGSGQRLIEQLTQVGLPIAEGAPRPGAVSVLTARLPQGYALPGSRLVVLTETDILGRRAAGATRLPSRRRRTLDPFTLQAGDTIVHDTHGIGRYLAMTQRTVGGIAREYLVLEYAPSKRGQPADRIYVPIDALDAVSRYVGGDAPAPHRLGGTDWSAAKGRARRAVAPIADALVRLYAARQSAQGRAFGPDTAWQRELEDAFDYVETPDQLSTIDAVKADMERGTPMDRVIVGDVGYGKTEIAVRAAFKAVADGAQVAVLVPTTLLVAQHLETFRSRYAPFPVTVRAMSRFQTEQEVAAVTAGLADGSVDVVIGTQRLLRAGVQFANLGLVIVDEEQRFGVEHKEYLKALRTNVDVLTMSATPIPRTLEMAVTGIRDMSVIQTPPEERLPVATFVGEQDDARVVAAIRRELIRDGQVFYIHNRVASIDRTAARLAELVGDARIAVAHGSMDETALERVIVDFWEHRTDVLVCTTIVESGLDIPNANTLIVERADRLGLAQMHQLRGRVGRGRERGYAYFLYPPDLALTEAAHERLSTIAARTALGSGMAVAMQDLQIRGAGSILGAEQSGHIAEVGFDMYVRLVGEAIAERKGETTPATADVRVELPITAHLPVAYVPDERVRLEAYRALAGAHDEPALTSIAQEWQDRFGTPPGEASLLLDLARLRLRARRAGLTEIAVAGQSIRLLPVSLVDSQRVRLARRYPQARHKPALQALLIPMPRPARIDAPPITGTPLLEWVTEVIDTVIDPAGAAAAPATADVGPRSNRPRATDPATPTP